jgi:DNA-binding XRE family transcriptional regulator
MDANKLKRLEQAGWQVGSADEFLELSREEACYVEVKLALSNELKRRRAKKGMTQTNLAKKIGSSQSRIAKAESSDPSVSVDLLVRALFATGATPSDLGRTITSRGRKKAV